MSQGPQNPFGENPYGGAPQYGGGVPPMPMPRNEGDATGGVIPYKNVPALLAYYLGLFSLFPCLGLFLAIPALILGIMGLRKRNANPAVKGAVHAWIGIIMGGIFTLIWGGMAIMWIVVMVAEANGG